MKALVEIKSGRVVQIENDADTFETAPGLVWKTCDNTITTSHKWNGAGFDAPVVPPPLTDAEVDAQMDARMADPYELSILEVMAARLPGPVSVDELRAEARARGRVNSPRNQF